VTQAGPTSSVPPSRSLPPGPVFDPADMPTDDIPRGGYGGSGRGGRGRKGGRDLGTVGSLKSSFMSSFVKATDTQIAATFVPPTTAPRSSPVLSTPSPSSSSASDR